MTHETGGCSCVRWFHATRKVRQRHACGRSVWRVRQKRRAFPSAFPGGKRWMRMLFGMYGFRYCIVTQPTADFRSVFWSNPIRWTETSDSGTGRNAKCQIVNLLLNRSSGFWKWAVGILTRLPFIIASLAICPMMFRNRYFPPEVCIAAIFSYNISRTEQTLYP